MAFGLRGKEKKKVRKDELTVFLLDNYSTVHIQSNDDQIGEDVHPPDAVEPHWVFEGDLLRHLHHAQNHDEVGSAHINISDQQQQATARRTSLHLRIHVEGMCG